MEQLPGSKAPPSGALAPHPGIVTTDITIGFRDAVKSLAPGQLVKDGLFTLLDSVSALEIMDPKMDSGCLAEGETLDDDYDVRRDLLPEEVIGIMDQLLCLEMAWHLGYPLSQTLFTSLYVDYISKVDPQNLRQANSSCLFGDTSTAGDVRKTPAQKTQEILLSALMAYCHGLLKGCHFVNEIVKEELYFEEEDFVTNTHDRDLIKDIPLEDINQMLQQARADLRTYGSSIPRRIHTAIDIRLEFRVAFCRALEISRLRKSNPDSLKMPWIQMSGALEHIKKLHELGKPVPEAFSSKIQRHLASTMPPRPIIQPSFEETYRHFKQLAQDGKEIMNVLKYHDPQSLLTFVFTFQARKPQPLVLIRTMLQSMIFKDLVILGSFSIRQIIDHDLSVVVLPGAPQLDGANDSIETPTHPRHQISMKMEEFRQRAAEPYFELLRIFCQNRCRVRRMMCHSIHEWDALQADAEEFDTLMQVVLNEQPINVNGQSGYSLPLSSWAYLYKLRQMEWIVQLGFELAIYQTDELAGMYWYLNWLAKTRAQHGDRIKTFVMSFYEGGAQQPQLFSPAQERDYSQSLAYIRVTMLDAACTWEFADGLCCLYTALQRLGLIATPSRPFSADSLRYELRMRPFRHIALPLLPAHDEFVRATTQPDNSVENLLRYADGAVGGARKGFEALGKMSDGQTFSVGCHDRWAAGVRNCLRAAVAAGEAVEAALKAVEARTAAGKEADGPEALGIKVEMPGEGEEHHPWWIVPKVVPVKAADERGD